MQDLQKCRAAFLSIMILTFPSVAYSHRSHSSKSDAKIHVASLLHSLWSAVPVRPEDFDAKYLASAIETAPCTLSGGTETECYKITVRSVPDEDHQAGPWCPDTVQDTGAEAGGIWMKDGILYQVDGPFIGSLATLYQDPYWNMTDGSGNVNVTDTRRSCRGAARPDVDERYYNHCVECQPEYLRRDQVYTFFIPKKPVMSLRETPLSRESGVGLALNGVRYDPPAPVADILRAYTLAPFDNCGGHINLHVGYHYHAATGCSVELSQPDEHAPKLGYAMDGIAIFGRLDRTGQEPADLDSCRGHRDEARGYHYHVAKPSDNQLIGCFQGEYGCVFDGDGSGKVCNAFVDAG